LVIGGAAAAGATVIHDRRTAGTQLDDQEIEIRALNLRTQNPDIGKHSEISVTSYNQVVLLTGQAETPQIRHRYAEMVAKIPRVKRVVNEIQIAPADSFSEDSADTYITAQVKLALFKVDSEGFDPGHVKVVTSSRIVYLMGLVTRTEADKVVEVVRHTEGVEKVVKVFDYIEAR
jgi:osmotically-inducible protein OsmY